MKALLVAEYRENQVRECTYELLSFAERLGAAPVMFIVGDADALPAFEGPLYLAEASTCGEFSPSVHKALLLEVIAREQPDYVVFSHSSYGWDLAPRVALATGAGQISEILDLHEEGFVVPLCNSKLRSTLKASGPLSVLTLQSGAFAAAEPQGSPQVMALDVPAGTDPLRFEGLEEAEKSEVDLSKAEIIVSAGRGIGKKDNIEMIANLAKAMGGEFGASRPVVDAGWAEHSRQVGSTGQSVAPKLYVACGISGAVQHLMGMKKSDFVIAINSDAEAPIAEVADVMVVADLKEFVPALLSCLQG